MNRETVLEYISEEILFQHTSFLRLKDLFHEEWVLHG